MYIRTTPRAGAPAPTAAIHRMPTAGRRPTVLFLLDWQPVPWSTREEYFARLCGALAARGITPVFTIPKVYAPEIEARMTAAGAVVAVQSHAKGAEAYRAFVHEMARTHDVRLAHVRFFTLDSPVPRYCREAGIRPVFYTEANGGEWTFGGIGGWIRRRRAARHHAAIDRFIAVSGFIRERLVAMGVPGDRIAVVPNGVDLATFHPDPAARAAVRAELGADAGTVALLWASKPLPIKRPRVAIAALAALVARGVDAHLWLAGIGTMQAELTAEAAAQGLDGRLRWLGHRKDIGALMAAADVLLHTTQGEAFGNVFVEAMAAGLPVVATRSGAVPEVVPPEAGVLVEPDAHEVAGLADGVVRALDPATRAAMQAAGAVAAQRFTIERAVDATLAQYAPYLG